MYLICLICQGFFDFINFIFLDLMDGEDESNSHDMGHGDILYFIIHFIVK